MAALLIASVVFVVAVTVGIILAYVRGWRWTGSIGDAPNQEGGERARVAGRKTLWDWMELLIVPAHLAGIAFAFSSAQNQRDRRQEARRAARELAIAADNRRQDALRDYLERMSNLILRDDVDASQRDSLARTLTRAVVRQLDGEREGIVVQFLADADAIGSRAAKHLDTDLLDGADLRGASLVGARLEKMNLSGADLRKANFEGALLDRANFMGADLRAARFRGAFIEGTEFWLTDARGADFSSAGAVRRPERENFREACVTKARLPQCRPHPREFHLREG